MVRVRCGVLGECECPSVEERHVESGKCKCWFVEPASESAVRRTSD